MQAEWLNRDIWPMRNGYMMLRGNALVNPEGGYLHFYGPVLLGITGVLEW